MENPERITRTLLAARAASALPTREKLALLDHFFRDCHALLVAFSGGLDSRFVCSRALARGSDVLAVHVTGPHISPDETRGARNFADTMGMKLRVIELNPLNVPEVAATDLLRCYHCKKAMLGAMRALCAEPGVQGRVLCDGSNFDDLSSYRPGMRALEEEGVISPLALAGLTKDEIRAEALRMGFPLPAEQARPCLLTRYDYGLPVHAEELRALARAERALLDLRDGDGNVLFTDLRVRLTPKPVLQVLRFEEEYRPLVEPVMAACGFSPFEVLVTPSISGYYDTVRASTSS